MKIIHKLNFELPIFAELQQKYPDSSIITYDTLEDLERECVDCDALIVPGSRYTKEVADLLKAKAKKLRWIQSGSDGLDKFTIAGIPEGVTMTNTRGMKGGTIAEHAIGFLIALHQRIPDYIHMMAAKEWRRDELRHKVGSIEGQTLVILGYGSIGQEVARKAKAFDSYVIAVNRSGQGEGAADEIVPVEQLKDVLPKADALFLCVPITKKTRKIIGKTELALLKPSAMIINVARGDLIDTDAMVDALKNNKLAGAGLDVVDPEPLPADHPLWNFDNVILSPHVSGNGGPLYERLGELYKENIEKFIRGEPLRNTISPEDYGI